ncbi:hypothetical protein BC332_15513 [Capsicum chinense]|nr:hypothetical protein BC332_15513 [Capsicum chinense]
MTLPLYMRTQPKPTLDASQYTTKPSEPSGRVRAGAEAKFTLTEFSEQLMGSKSLKHYSEVVCMLIFATGVNKDVINEDYDEHIQVLLEHSVHQVHEDCWGICKTKRHD